MKKFTIECQTTEHHAIHEHPAYERRCGAFVEAWNAFVAEGEEETLQGTAELGLGGGLETDFDRVKGMADC